MKQSYLRITTYAFLAFASLAVMGQGNGGETFSEGSHCVAYRAYKKALIVNDSTIVGKNCHITAEVEELKRKRVRVRVQIPIIMFNSGNANRDRAVTKFLKIDEQQFLEFHSRPYRIKQIRKGLKTGKLVIKGFLNIGKKDYPIVANLRIEGQEPGRVIKGVVKSTFDKLGIEKPELGLMRFILTARDNFDILFHLQAAKVRNFGIL